MQGLRGARTSHHEGLRRSQLGYRRSCGSSNRTHDDPLTQLLQSRRQLLDRRPRHLVVLQHLHKDLNGSVEVEVSNVEVLVLLSERVSCSLRQAGVSYDQQRCQEVLLDLFDVLAPEVRGDPWIVASTRIEGGNELVPHLVVLRVRV